MKTILWVLLTIIGVSQLSSQGFYPLQVGNIWQYQSGDIMYPEFSETKIIGDTILSNGKTYAVFKNGSGFGDKFLRQEGSKVFAYSSYDSLEYVLFDFSANINDTICQRGKGKSTIVLKNKSYNTFNNRTVWLFVDYFGDSLSSYDFSHWSIEDSIGLTNSIVEPGNRYHLTGAIINGKIIGTITNVHSNNLGIPENPKLFQNYPNPFNPSTNISFDIPEKSFVSLKVFDIVGREVANLVSEELSEGNYSRQWDASNMPSGVYFYCLQTGTFKETKKLVLLK